MKVTKIGHCCLLIEVKGKRILTDPGSFTVRKHELKDIDVVLITHEHGDHVHVESLKEIVAQNPDVTIYTNTGVGKLLDEAGIEYFKLEGTDSTQFGDIEIEALDGKHAEIFEDFGQVQNTGYFIDRHLFYPGDSYIEPEEAVPVLALPVAGPWCKLSDTLHYAINVKPKKAFPVHDGLLNSAGVEIIHGVAKAVLAENEVDFVSLEAGDVEEF